MSLLMRRRALMNINETTGLLPSIYQQVEYIESTGTQYLDIEERAFGSSEIECKFQFTQNLAGFIFGARKTSSANQTTLLINSSGYLVCCAMAFAAQNIQKYDNNVHSIVMNSKTVVFDNEITLNFTNGVPSPTTLNLFACNDESIGEGYSKSYSRIYYFRMSNNGILIRDLIPCYRISDDVIGMYDMVNGVFYTNKGTGTFLKGADV